MIAGFTVVRNGLRNGYPFVEAIRSALRLCDVVYASEGFSEDGSYSVLQRLAEQEPHLRVRRDRWLTSGAAGEPIRSILNAVRADLKEEIIFQFDANEILPPEAVPLLREAPDLYPKRELFAMPYHQFLGRYWFNEEFRFRLFRNRPWIWALWDGWTLGHHLGPLDLVRAPHFRRILGRTALAVLQDRVAVDLPEVHLHLPRPIFHYYGMFPEAFWEKMKAKVWLQDNPGYRSLTEENPAVRHLMDEYRRTGEYDRFWKGVLDFQRAERSRGVPFNKEFLYARFVPDSGHPEILQGILGQPRYVPRGVAVPSEATTD